MRYIRYKYQKQQINFLNCNDINKWIDTCQTRVIGFDSVCESNCNCGEIRDMEYQPQYRTKKLNPNYSYECVDMDRHYKLQKQISYDNGITWMDIDEYEIGELYESNSPFCSAEVIIYDWFPTGRYKCVGYNKINEEVKRVSFDNGLNWSDLSFVDDNGNVTYEYRFNASNIEENCCDCGYREYEYRISNPIEYVCDVNTKSEVWYKWQYCPTDPSLDVKLDEVELRNPVEDEDYCGINVYFVWDASSINYCQFKLNNTSYSATTENSVLNDDGTYTYTASLSDLGIKEVTRRNAMFSYNETLLKLYKVPKSNDTSLKYMLIDCYNLNYIDANAFGDTSNVTDMSNMFNYCSGLTSLDLSNFNTSNVTTMNSMFRNCDGLTSLDLSSFNTSAVTNMQYMFNSCSGLTSLDLSNFDTSNVNYMSYMFQNCRSLTSLDLSSFNTSKITNMNYMFAGCRVLTSLDLSSFDTSKVTSMNNMFAGCINLTSLDLSNFDTSALTNIGYMFQNCYSLTSLNLSNWDTSNVTTITRMFGNCTSLSEIIMDNCSCDTVSFIIDRLNDASLQNVLIYSNSGCEGTNCHQTTDREYNGYLIDVIKPSCEFYEVSNFNVYKVYTDTNTDINCNVTTSNGVELYLENQIPNSVNPSGYNDTDVIRTVTAYTDYGEYTFEQNYNTAQARTLIYEWNTNKSSSSLRYYKTTSSSISISSFSTHPVNYLFEFDVERIIFSGTHITNLIQMVRMDTITDMASMFRDCSGLTSLDTSGWNTSNVYDMSTMFYNCSGLTSLDLSGLDTSKVKYMYHMFYKCRSLTSLDLSSFNTSAVTDMGSMFSDCYNLTSLDLSNWDTSKVTSMGYMFQYCSGLTSLDLSGWHFSYYEYSSPSSVYIRGMFYGCANLTSITFDNCVFDYNEYTPDNLFEYCEKLEKIYMRNCPAAFINTIKRGLDYEGILSNVTIITD